MILSFSTVTDVLHETKLLFLPVIYKDVKMSVLSLNEFSKSDRSSLTAKTSAKRFVLRNYDGVGGYQQKFFVNY